jgi:hypothetical protein
MNTKRIIIQTFVSLALIFTFCLNSCEPLFECDPFFGCYTCTCPSKIGRGGSIIEQGGTYEDVTKDEAKEYEKKGCDCWNY